MPLSVEIVTPSQVVCSEEVASLVVDSALGELELLPQHRPLIALLVNGSVRMKRSDGTSETVATSQGILHLENDRAVLVVEEAVNIQQLPGGIEIKDAQKLAEDALKTARERGNLEQNIIDQLEAKVRSELVKKLKSSE